MPKAKEVEVQEIKTVETVKEITKKPRSKRSYVKPLIEANEELERIVLPRYSYNEETQISSHKHQTKDGKEYFGYVMSTIKNDIEVKSILFNVFSDTKNFSDEKMLNGELRVILRDVVEYTEGDTLNYDITKTADSDFTMAERVMVLVSRS